VWATVDVDAQRGAHLAVLGEVAPHRVDDAPVARFD
jgi:hypothetical protein